MVDKSERVERPESDKTIIDHVADKLIDRKKTPGEPVVQKSRTRTGKPVEEQVRKEWDPNKKGGLPTFLNIR